MTLQRGDQTYKLLIRAADARLVDLAKTGDDDAYAELVKGASCMAFRAIRRILPVEADAQDALQEACIRSYCKLSTLGGRKKSSTVSPPLGLISALMSRR